MHSSQSLEDQIGTADTSRFVVRERTGAATPKARRWSFALAGLIVGLLYTANVFYCEHSTLKFMDVALPNSDMHANLMWARSIREQGWLNAAPYHPWNDWMQQIAPYSQWVEWWGGEQIFQQSPLYAYLLSPFVEHLIIFRILQALMGIGTCVFIGLFTARMASRAAGWIAFWLAALYAPFYAYSWPFLRDGIGWLLTAAALWALSEMTATVWPSGRARLFGWLAGVLLGLGFLARETYLLLIPVVWITLACIAWKRRHWGIVTRTALATVLTICPLVYRNWVVKAPLLSSSNRAAEVFIASNAAGARPYIFTIPAATQGILAETHGRTWPAIQASIASYPDGVRGWARLQVLRFISLFDPYESGDNLSFYFVAHISPVVRFGLRYWMILPIALAGLFLSIARKEHAQLWMWVFLPIVLSSVLFGTAVSRYRQSLMIFFIPWTAYFLMIMWSLINRRKFRTSAYWAMALLAGWALICGPLSRQPRGQYERPQEYFASVMIYHWLGEEQNERAMLAFARRMFPGVSYPEF